MTNEMIILNERIVLMEQGILKGTGIKIIVEDENGNKKELDMPEEIHTYQRWKLLGYQVKKGQKAKAQFPIWKYTQGKKKDMTEEEAQKKGYCFMKKASWFTREQVEEVSNEI